jgi:tRNA(Met) C34 N-acetyltransferase TmcA
LVTLPQLIKEGHTLVVTFKKSRIIKDYIMKFNDEYHYENFCKKMEKGGWKEIGTNIHKPLYQMNKKNILEARVESIDYTNDQKDALLLIKEFLEDKSENFFLLVGNAGTGKTTIAENIANYADADMLAPTNAAVKKLIDRIKSSYVNEDRFRTIHQQIYGAPDKETGKFIRKQEFNENRVYLIDESSMIDKKVLSDIIAGVGDKRTKIIFMGEICPV